MMRTRRTQTGAAGAILLLAALAAGCGGDNDASSATDTKLAGDSIDKICAAGKSEGAVRREATPDQAGDWDKYGSGFTDKYGIDVKVSDGSGGGGRDLPAKFLPEKQTGKELSADVFQGRQYDVSVLLNDDYTEDID